LEDPSSYWDKLRKRAEDLNAMFAADQAVTEAELAANGIRPVSVVHGDPESSEDADLIHELHRLAEECGTLSGYRGGGDYTTFLFTGHGADSAAVAFTAAAVAIARRWWRITPTAQPVFRSSGEI
jgi:hypothetical protein